MSDGFNDHKGDGFFGTGFGGSASLPPLYAYLIQRNISIDPVTTNEFNDLLDELYVTQAQAIESNCGNFDGTTCIGFFISNPSTDYFGAIKITSHFILADIDGTYVVHSLGTAAYRLYTVASSGNLYVNSTNTGHPIAPGTINTCVAYFDSSGTAYRIDLNGVDNAWTGSAVGNAGGEDNFYVGCRVSSGVPGLKFSGQIFGVEVEGFIDAPMAEGAGTSVNNKIPSGLVGTISSGDIDSFWTGTQDIYHDHLKSGFSLYEHATEDPVYVSFLTTGIPNPTPTVPAGYTLTKHVDGTDSSGAMLNDAETKVLGTDAQMLACSLYSPDGLTFTAFSFEEAQAFVSGNDNHCLKWGLDKYGSCMLVADNQYDFTADLQADVEMYNRFVNYYADPNGCGAGFIPFT